MKLGLISQPDRKVKEIYKVYRKSLKINLNTFTISFQVDNMLNPKDCQITIDSI
jgi:hypothetical protein